MIGHLINKFLEKLLYYTIKKYNLFIVNSNQIVKADSIPIGVNIVMLNHSKIIGDSNHKLTGKIDTKVNG